MSTNRIVFDMVAADELLRQMNEYCTGIQRETVTLLEGMDRPAEWRDSQYEAFQTKLLEIAGGLKDVLRLESDNMNIFYRRVVELRE